MKRYTPEQRADALVLLTASGGQSRRTARQTGIPESTLRHWRNGTRAPEARAMGARKNRPTAEACEHIAALLLKSIEGKLDTGTAVGLATVFGIMVDKAQILRASAPPPEPEQPIDLSRLTPEQLETLNGWLQDTV